MVIEHNICDWLDRDREASLYESTYIISDWVVIIIYIYISSGSFLGFLVARYVNIYQEIEVLTYWHDSDANRRISDFFWPPLLIYLL